MRTQLVRIAVIIVTGLLGSVAVIPTAGAAPGQALDQAVSGPFTGLTSFTFGTDGCSFVHQTYDGTVGTGHKPAGTFHLAGCVDVVGTFHYTGSFGMDLKGNGSLTGTVDGTVGSGPTPCVPLDFVLTVKGGTGRFTRASGTIALHGTWCASGIIPAVDDPITGQLVGSLTHS